jgi:hypothetical protein
MTGSEGLRGSSSDKALPAQHVETKGVRRQELGGIGSTNDAERLMGRAEKGAFFAWDTQDKQGNIVLAVTLRNIPNVSKKPVTVVLRKTAEGGIEIDRSMMDPLLKDFSFRNDSSGKNHFPSEKDFIGHLVGKGYISSVRQVDAESLESLEALATYKKEKQQSLITRIVQRIFNRTNTKAIDAKVSELHGYDSEVHSAQEARQKVDDMEGAALVIHKDPNRSNLYVITYRSSKDKEIRQTAFTPTPDSVKKEGGPKWLISKYGEKWQEYDSKSPSFTGRILSVFDDSVAQYTFPWKADERVSKPYFEETSEAESETAVSPVLADDQGTDPNYGRLPDVRTRASTSPDEPGQTYGWARVDGDVNDEVQQASDAVHDIGTSLIVGVAGGYGQIPGAATASDPVGHGYGQIPGYVRHSVGDSSEVVAATNAAAGNILYFLEIRWKTREDAEEVLRDAKERSYAIVDDGINPEYILFSTRSKEGARLKMNELRIEEGASISEMIVDLKIQSIDYSDPSEQPASGGARYTGISPNGSSDNSKIRAVQRVSASG